MGQAAQRALLHDPSFAGCSVTLFGEKFSDLMNLGSTELSQVVCVCFT